MNNAGHPLMEDTIVALATPQGIGALGIVRLSGNQALDIASAVFKGKDLTRQPSHTIHFGRIVDGEKIIDEALASIFIAPKSFTRENVVEFSCHGSSFVLQQVIRLLIEKGARLAKPGEFTQRAFLNGQFDLAQAEAIADLINADTEATHFTAMNQMRGGFSRMIKELREELIHFASMIELELDFAEEDVEFASREELKKLISRITSVIDKLTESFQLGNVIKNGVPTVIAGRPNAGKSTLLNALLHEEKAIVSEIPGTTRDFIEDEIHINGISFRFIDTAGIREARDKIEAIGIQRTREKMKAAALIVYMFDLSEELPEEIQQETDNLRQLGIPFIRVGNKIDTAPAATVKHLESGNDMVLISAAQETNIDVLKKKLTDIVHLPDFKTGDAIVTNLRHYDSLMQTKSALKAVVEGINQGITNDFLALDIRQALHHLGEITGQITTDDLLDNIFSKFCIGK